MTERVRGICITPAGNLLTIKRVRSHMDPYWVLPGGHVEPGDGSLEAALLRELAEELAGKASVVALVHSLEIDGERQHFFLARVETWDPARRSGPEFSDASRGQYIVEEIPLVRSRLAQIALKPEPIARFLTEHGDRLFQLDDLRDGMISESRLVVASEIANPDAARRRPDRSA
ncbi:NUDIX hydrolase [Acrocarpospora catenulata]|uniref:NUDIX hydrolase n=1 Tax=Acrocarpospora catenulata TaxID=2836182 RepID=UPI001BD9773B|nr:NUDIX domain-containing protein [Acrocarpospora catenulata]